MSIYNKNDARLSYLQALQASLTYGRCAGRVTELSKLHQNRLVSKIRKIQSFLDFREKVVIIQKALVRLSEENNMWGDNTRTARLYHLLFAYDQPQESEENVDVFTRFECLIYRCIECGAEIFKGLSVCYDCGTVNDEEYAENSSRTSFNNDHLKTAIDRIDTIFRDDENDLLSKDSLMNIDRICLKLTKNIKQLFNSNEANLLKELEAKKQLKLDFRTEEERALSEYQLELDNLEEWLRDFPGVESEEISKPIRNKIDTLTNAISNIKNNIAVCTSQIEQYQKEYELKKVIYEENLEPWINDFNELIKEREDSIFGDLDKLLTSMKIGECKPDDVLFGLDEGGLVTVVGDPGYGKTIQIRQFTNNLISNEIEKKEGVFPFFMKAKDLASSFDQYFDSRIEEAHTNFSSTYQSWVRRKKAPLNPFVKDQQELHRLRVERALRYGNKDDFSNAVVEEFVSEVDQQEECVPLNLFLLFKKASLSSEPGIEWAVENIEPSNIKMNEVVLIIDAFDEVITKQKRNDIMIFLSRLVNVCRLKVIITCRKSHTHEIDEVVDLHGMSDKYSQLGIYFTEHELQFEMPMKLANAWGINSAQLSHSAAIQFDNYDLRHPLFVGLFCMLIVDNALPKPEGITKGTMKLSGPISFENVLFLKKVIEHGLNISIKEREKISDDKLERIRRIFYYIASTSLITGLSKMSHILHYILVRHGILVTEEEKKILNENLGVMFVNGENQIEWTHKTLPEIATGMLINKESSYRDYLISEFGTIFGERGALWSECLLMTVIQGDSKQHNDQRIYEELKLLFPEMGIDALKSTINMFGITKDFGWLDVKSSKNNATSFSYGLRCQEAYYPIIKALMDSYFEKLNSGKPFPIPNFILNNQTKKKEFLKRLFEVSNPGNIYAEVVDNPLKLTFPNLSIDDIFAKFNNNLPDILAFCIEREKIGLDQIHPNFETSKKIFTTLSTKIKEQKSILFNHHLDLFSIPLMLYSLNYEHLLKLMESVCEKYQGEFDIDVKSLTRSCHDNINSTILRERNLKSRFNKSNNMVKITSGHLRKYYPNFLRVLLSQVISIEHGDIPEVIQLREKWGLPEGKWVDINHAYNRIPSGFEGDVYCIPNWIPRDAYLLVKINYLGL